MLSSRRSSLDSRVVAFRVPDSHSLPSRSPGPPHRLPPLPPQGVPPSSPWPPPPGTPPSSPYSPTSRDTSFLSLFPHLQGYLPLLFPRGKSRLGPFRGPVRWTRYPHIRGHVPSETPRPFATRVRVEPQSVPTSTIPLTPLTGVSRASLRPSVTGTCDPQGSGTLRGYRPSTVVHRPVVPLGLTAKSTAIRPSV